MEEDEDVRWYCCRLLRGGGVGGGEGDCCCEVGGEVGLGWESWWHFCLPFLLFLVFLVLLVFILVFAVVVCMNFQ